MMLSPSVTWAAALIASAFAQTTSQPSSSISETSIAISATHIVSVGANGHHFEPSQVKAKVGDIIDFQFYPQNHSVARANFGQPCIPYEITGQGRIGFWSEFRPIDVVLTKPPSFQVRINDTEPVFYYCSAPGACLDGMIGVINPNSTQTFAIQYELSQNTTQQLSPGEPFFEPELESTRTRGSPTPTSTTAVASSNLVNADHPHSLSTAVIAGIVIAAVFAVVLAAAVLYICGRQKTINEILHRQSAAPNPPSVYHPDLPGYAEAQYPNMAKPHMSVISSSAGRYRQTPYDFGMIPTTIGGRNCRTSSLPVDDRRGIDSNTSGVSGTEIEGSPRFPSPRFSLYESYNIDRNKKSLQQVQPKHFAPVELPAPLAPSRTGPS